MKKQLILFLVLLINLSSVYARSITFRIINNSNTTFLRSKVEDNPEKGYCNLTMPDQNLLQWDHLEPGRECVFKIVNERAFCGLEGFVEWSTSINNKMYLINMTFDIPFVGGNEFVYSCSYPFVMKHFSGDGEGGEVELVFELSGSIPQQADPAPPPPPPPPINLPVTGNKTFKGHIYWDSDEVGLPPSGNMQQKFLNYLTTAFKVEMLAPTQFARNSDGSGSETYSGMNGYYTNFEKLKNAKIVFKDGREEENQQMEKYNIMKNNKQKINFYISNLPENIPINISINTKNANWDAGKKTPKPPANKESKWMVFIHEKKKDEQSISYEVNGAWFFGDGGYSSDNITPITLGLLQQMKQKTNLLHFIPLKGELKRKIVTPITKQKLTESNEIKSQPINTHVNQKVNIQRNQSLKQKQ